MYIYIYMFSKHSPARARAPDIRIAHISVADRRCAVCCAFVTRYTHACSCANDDYCRCINVMCSIAMKTSASKNFTIRYLQLRSYNIIYLNPFIALSDQNIECNIYIHMYTADRYRLKK